MAKRTPAAIWATAFQRSFAALARQNIRAGSRALRQSVKPRADARKPPPGPGEWTAGVVMGPAGVRRYRLYRPPHLRFAERLPLVVMLHGCGQDAKSFALSTRMNRIAARERFMVLYPEQDRLANAGGCWNWYDTQSGRAWGEAGLIIQAIDQVCLLYAADRTRVAVAGLSAGASMAALLVTRHPARFKAVVMHSGIPPGTAHSSLSALGAMQGQRDTRPMDTAPDWPPLLVIHGGSDRVVAASNAHTAVQVWADAAGARPVKARVQQRGKRYPMTVTDFKHRGSTAATLVQVPKLGHAWSGGAQAQPHGDALGPDASRMVWTFVSKQFREHVVA